MSAARVFATLGLMTAPAFADRIEAIGPVYPIAEPDLLVQIREALKAKQAAGDIERYYREARKRAEGALESPKPVTGLTTVTTARSYERDPTVTLTDAVTDQTGRILVPAGTRVNPLSTLTLSKRLFFFDARDPRQVTQAKTLLDREGAAVKLILVAGSYMELMRAWKRPVYFDQDGEIVRRLGITQVPALVTQVGPRLRIDEVLPGSSL